jgi:hypothetical protein
VQNRKRGFVSVHPSFQHTSFLTYFLSLNVADRSLSYRTNRGFPYKVLILLLWEAPRTLAKNHVLAAKWFTHRSPVITMFVGTCLSSTFPSLTGICYGESYSLEFSEFARWTICQCSRGNVPNPRGDRFPFTCCMAQSSDCFSFHNCLLFLLYSGEDHVKLPLERITERFLGKLTLHVIYWLICRKY